MKSIRKNEGTSAVISFSESRLGAKIWERLELKNLRQLMFPQEVACATVYFHVKHWREYLPGAVEEAEGRLLRIVGREMTDSLLKPMRALAQRLSEDERSGKMDAFKSIGVFRSQNTVAYVYLIDEVEEQVVVAASFHLRPILNLIQDSYRFYVMVVEAERARLYLGTEHALELLSDYTPGPEHRKNRKSAVLLDKFYFTINERIRKSGELGHSPMFLVGPSDLMQAYRAVNSYAHVIDEPVAKGFDPDDLRAIQAKVWPRVSKWYLEKESSALTDFERGKDQRKAADDLEEIARASVKGRVKTLILAKGVHLWGQVATTGRIAVQDPKDLPRTDDLLDDLAEAVVARGGQVISLDQQRMPTESPIAAVYHW